MPESARGSEWLAAGDGADDEIWFAAGDDGFGKRSIGRLMRQILLAGEEAKERAALAGDLVTSRAAQHRVLLLQRIENRSAGDRSRDFELDFVARRVPSYAGEDAEMGRENDADHLSALRSKRLDFDRKDGGQIAHNRRPGIAAIG